MFAISDGSDDSAASGLLIPNLSLSSSNGVELGVPYYLRSPTTRTSRSPRTSTPRRCRRWKRASATSTSLGAYQIGGFVTYGKIDNIDEVNAITNEGSRRGIRAYIEANGRFQFSPEWSLTSSIRLATDKTVTRRYDLTRDDRLRNFVEAERITPNSYLSIAGWAFEGLRADDVQKQFPIALPADRRAAAARGSVARRHDRAPGQQPGDPAHRRAGHAARLRQREMGPAPADPRRAGIDADRLRARRRLSQQ